MNRVQPLSYNVYTNTVAGQNGDHVFRDGDKRFARNRSDILKPAPNHNILAA
jgi:hypothetical protein